MENNTEKELVHSAENAAVIDQETKKSTIEFTPPTEEEKTERHIQDRADIEALTAELSTPAATFAKEIEKITEAKPDGSEVWKDERADHEKQKPETKNSNSVGRKLRNFGMALFGGLILSGSAKAGTTEKNPNDSTDMPGKKTEKVIPVKEKKDKKEGVLPVYTKSKTKQGATTPTGLNNSFFNNEHGIQPEDIDTIAKQFNFRTGSVKEFQEDLFKKFPDIEKHLKEKYGMPAAGVMADNIAGVRLSEAIAEVKKKTETIIPKKETKEANPFAAFSTMGEALYGPDRHIVAEIFYPVRSTNSITNAGMINTADPEEPVLIRWRNDFGFDGNYVIIKGGDLQNYTGTGREFGSAAKVSKLKGESTSLSKEQKAYNLLSKDIAQGTTIH